jgi:dihydrofolate reductase
MCTTRRVIYALFTGQGTDTMRKLMVWMNLSLDGCADHTVTIADDELHEFSTRLLDTIDILLFGRITYELMDAWHNIHNEPEATASMFDFALKFTAKPKIVFSRTLGETLRPNESIIREDAVEEVKRLKNQPGKKLSIGGISISREFIEQGLVDEYMLLIQPVIWGKGRRLFDGTNQKKKLALVDTKTFKSGVIVLHYES